MFSAGRGVCDGGGEVSVPVYPAVQSGPLVVPVGRVGQEPGDQGLLLLVHGVAPLLLALGVDRRALADGVVAQPLADVAGVPVMENAN